MKATISVLITVVLFLASYSAYAGKKYADPEHQLRAYYNVYQLAQQLSPSKIENIKSQIIGKKKMKKGVARFMRNNVDWDTHAELSFKDYDKLTKKQKKQLSNLLRTLTTRRYARLFSPSKRFMVQFKQPIKYITVRGKEYARVDAMVTIWESKSEVELSFLLRKGEKGLWLLCDVYVDGVSKARVYRAELRKIFKRKGFKGVVRTLNRNAAKYDGRLALRKNTRKRK